MAKTRIVLDFSFSVDQLKDSISKADLTGKEALEVYYGFHALKAWRSEFEETNGGLQSMLHHSNPDDPPDLVFQFSDRELCAELTVIEPHPYGQARALQREKFPNEPVTIPPLSGTYESKQDIEKVMFSKNMTPDKWETVADHERVLFASVEQQISRKIEKLNARSLEVDLLILIDRSLIFDSAVLSLANYLCAISKDRRLAISDKTLLLLHSHSSASQFRSFIIYTDGSMKKQFIELIPKEWLETQMTFAELETEIVSDERREEFKGSLTKGDQLWRFRSREEPLLGGGRCEGIAISRNGEVVTSLITKWTDPS
jgi:hypothetical protein